MVLVSDTKHTIHIRHIGHVPIVERLVEGFCAIKHFFHIRHFFGHVPSKKNFVLHFNMSFDESGILTGIFPGGQTSLCAPPNCQIQAVNSVVGIHTHPVGERVSSADLVTAIKLHPEMNRQNKRRLSMVIAPKGIYIYKPTHHIIELYKGPYR